MFWKKWALLREQSRWATRVVKAAVVVVSFVALLSGAAVARANYGYPIQGWRGLVELVFPQLLPEVLRTAAGPELFWRADAIQILLMLLIGAMVFKCVMSSFFARVSRLLEAIPELENTRQNEHDE